jgi:hypothetical protein
MGDVSIIMEGAVLPVLRFGVGIVLGVILAAITWK